MTAALIEQRIVGRLVRAVLVRDGLVTEGPLMVDDGALGRFEGDLRGFVVLLPEGSHAREGWRHDETTGDLSPPLLTREQRIEQINARSQEILDQGFVFRGQWMSLSDRAQDQIRDATQNRDSLSYPIPWGNADDTAYVLLVSPADVRSLYDAAARRKQETLIEGARLRARVLDAATVADWNAIVDTR